MNKLWLYNMQRAIWKCKMFVQCETSRRFTRKVMVVVCVCLCNVKFVDNQKLLRCCRIASRTFVIKMDQSWMRMDRWMEVYDMEVISFIDFAPVWNAKIWDSYLKCKNMRTLFEMQKIWESWRLTRWRNNYSWKESMWGMIGGFGMVKLQDMKQLVGVISDMILWLNYLIRKELSTEILCN